MATSIPDSHKDLLEGPVFTVITTLKPNGQPHSTVVWATYDGEHVYVNTRQHSRKVKNLNNNPRVTLMAIDPENFYRWIEVEGRVTEITREGALDHINQLAKLYTGKDRYYGELAPAEQQQKETRVRVKIEPHKVIPFGG